MSLDYMYSYFLLQLCLTYTFASICRLWDLKTCYLSSGGEVWSVRRWRGTSRTAVEEALIEEIRGDEQIRAGKGTAVEFSQHTTIRR